MFTKANANLSLRQLKPNTGVQEQEFQALQDLGTIINYKLTTWQQHDNGKHNSSLLAIKLLPAKGW